MFRQSFGHLSVEAFAEVVRLVLTTEDADTFRPDFLDPVFLNVQVELAERRTGRNRKKSDVLLHFSDATEHVIPWKVR